MREIGIQECAAGGLCSLGTALTDAWLDLVAAGILNALAERKLQFLLSG